VERAINQLKTLLIAALCVSLSLAIFFAAPIIKVTRIITYKTWLPEGIIETATKEDTIWITPYQLLSGGGVFLDVTDLKSLKETLDNTRFREEYRPSKAEIGCGEKSAILMKYLEEKGFRVSMGRGTISRDDEEEAVNHAWVLVHLEDNTYVVEVNTESRYADIVGTVKEAAESQTLKYNEKERWDMEKVKEKYSELLKDSLNKYLETEKK